MRLLKSIFCCLILLPAILHGQTISGVVKDDTGKPVQGVSVSIRNKGGGTETDAAGRFTLAAPQGSTLLITSIGFEDVSLPVTTKTSYQVVLRQRPGALNDVVVVGYGTQRRKDLTGAVGTVNVQDLQKAPVMSFDQALAGRVAGVQVSSDDGQPGSGVNIIIRGANSITQDNSPLYVIDGFPREGGDVNNNALDPNDIESMTVLKDAAATAIYGARGANGVILITTKRGKAGAPVISLNVTQGSQSILKKMDMLGPVDWAKLQLDNTLATPPPTSYASGVINSHPYNYYTDSVQPLNMQDLLFNAAHFQNYSLSLSGGNDQTTYAMSGNYADQNGVMVNSNYKRYEGRLVIDQKVGSKLRVGVNATYSYTRQSGISPSAVANGTASGSLMYSILAYPPFTAQGALANTLEDPIVAGITNSNDYLFNPLLNQENLVRLNKLGELFTNAYAEYAILPSLRFRVTGGIDYITGQNVAYNDTLTLNGSPETPVGANGANGTVANTTTSQWSNENTLTYTKVFHNVHNFTALVGFSEQGYHTSTYTMGNTGLTYPNLGISGITQSNITTGVSLGESSGLWTAASYFGRVNYDYKSKYYLSASIRSDGSSKFAAQNHWSYFPAVSAKWRFSEEGFFKELKRVISDGGIRASYGASGNNRIPIFSYLSQIATGYTGVPNNSTFGPYSPAYTFSNVVSAAAVASVLGNADLKWETTKTVDLGLDMGFLDNRISLTADVYRKNTYNLLYNSPEPTSTGFKTAYRNIGGIQNQGLEITINTINLRRKNFTWSTSFNTSFNANKVLSLTQGLESAPVTVAWNNSITVPAYLLKVGKPLGTMYGLDWVGNYQYSDFVKNSSGQYILKDNVPTNQSSRTATAGTAPQPGDIKFKDINGDGVINANDQVPIGRGYPINVGGLSNDFMYKGFDLDVLLQWSYGNDIQNANRMIFENNATGINQFASVKDRWTPTNPNNVMFRAGTGSPQGPSYYSSRTVENGSYLRLKTVSLGYNLSKHLLDRYRIKGVRIYVSGQNLLTWTKYKGYDPEVNTFYGNLSPGFDYGSYPRARTLTVGANLNF